MNSVKHNLTRDTIRQNTNADKTLLILRRGSDAASSVMTQAWCTRLQAQHGRHKYSFFLRHAEARGGMGSSLPVTAHRE